MQFKQFIKIFIQNIINPYFRRTEHRIRIMIAGPLLISLLVLLCGIVILRLVEQKITGIGLSNEIINDLYISLKITILFFTIISAIAGFLLFYVVIKPLQHITETVKNVATGKFIPVQPIFTHQEIGVLQKSFNQMVTSLSHNIHERNRYILESITGALIILDTEGKITTINTAACSILAVAEHQIHGKILFDILPSVPGNQQFFQMFHNSLQYQMTYSSEEISFISCNNRKLTIGITISLLKDKQNLSLGLVATFKDLSKIKQIQQQLHRSDRLAAIGTLATGLAHEIRNPLASMRGLAQLLSEDIQPEDPKYRYAKVIIKEIDRLNHVVNELLTFSQASKNALQYNDINIALRDALFIARQNPKFLNNINIIENYYTQIPLIQFEKEKIIQVFLNIILNALEAISEYPTNSAFIELKSYLSDPQPNYPIPNLGFVSIDIINTGNPIAPEHLEHIFNPFFTTKESGTGLGLSIAYQIIAAHNGIIEVYSEPDKPTLFKILFPIIKQMEDTNIAQPT